MSEATKTKRQPSAAAIERQAESLSKARQGVSLCNYAAIYDGFGAMGIPEGEIHPRVNVFTFGAWKALGRQVRKGQHGVKVHTRIPVRDTSMDEATGKEVQEVTTRPWTSTVFHVSQTDPIGEIEDARAKRPAAAVATPVFF